MLIMILHLDPGEIDFAIRCGRDSEKQSAVVETKHSLLTLGVTWG